MNKDFLFSFDRIEFQPGQKLHSDELEIFRQREQWLRRIHNRYLHNEWGIALGLEVSLKNENSHVLVVQGYALDSCGHPILLPESRLIPAPVREGNHLYFLVLAYKPDSAYQHARQLGHLNSVGNGINPNFDRGEIRWLTLDEVNIGKHVPLAKAFVENGHIQNELDTSVRCYTKRHIRPHIAQGRSEPGRSGWRVWQAADGEEELGIELVVDTTQAGFLSQPAYFATLVTDFLDRPIQAVPGTSLSFDGLGFIAKAQKNHFVYQLQGSAENSIPLPEIIEAENRQWHIVWHGIEMTEGLEPEFTIMKAFFNFGLPLSFNLGTE